MMSFTYLTIAMFFDPIRKEATDAYLASQKAETHQGGAVRDALRGKGVHFLSITTVPAGEGHEAVLVIESSHDGEKDAAIQTLADALGDTLKAVMSAAGIAGTRSGLVTLLTRHSIDTGITLRSVPGLNHRGAPGMTVDRIFAENKLAVDLRKIVSEDRSAGASLPRLRAIREQIGNNPKHSQMMTPDDVGFLAPPANAQGGIGLIVALAFRALLDFAWPVLIPAALVILGIGYWAATDEGVWAGIGAGVLAALVFVFLLLGLVAAIYAAIRRKETTDLPDDSAPDFARLSAVMDIEDDGDVNHLAGISVMKPGWLRRFTLRFAFWTIGQLAARQFRPGFLADLGTIHSARWVLIPGTNKLLFFSNYSGSWESYLEDFITKAANGLTGVWSNTEGFPRAANIFFDGATDGDRFKRWARRQQHPSHFWYRAYPNKTVHTVRLNAAIRHGLLTSATEDEASAWFDLFGSRQRRAVSLETDEIQKLMFGGMRALRDGVCYTLRLPDDPSAARSWLQLAEPHVSFGDARPGASAMILALTNSGLERLGLTTDQLASFPPAFRQGMTTPKRAKSVLMDTGDDDPKHWDWGHEDNAVDLALYVLAVPDSEGNTALSIAQGLITALPNKGGAVVSKIETEQMPEMGNPIREPFGFVDGVSQPIIRGTPRWPGNQGSRDVAEPGEFILGYPDNRGFIPPTPTVTATADPGNLLPAVSSKAVDTQWPDFQRSTANADRDLGRNGSFMVIRQMDQSVDLFNARAAEMAEEIKDHPLAPPGLSQDQLATWIKSKAVGRWPDGTSLTRHPFAPGTGWDGTRARSPDNDFLHGEEDPEGQRCPLSSHVRRTNPRESFEPGSQRQQ